jgi:ankyrin repeat protein
MATGNMQKAIDEACRQGDNKLVESLLAREAVDVNSILQGWTFLQRAMCHGHPSVVIVLLANPHIRLDLTHEVRGRTGLHWSCDMNNVSVIGLFGGDTRCSSGILNMKDNDGESALMIAIRRGNLECVKELYTLQDIDFATRNRVGRTIIGVARKQNWEDIIKFLEENNTGEMQPDGGILTLSDNNESHGPAAHGEGSDALSSYLDVLPM